MDILFIHPNASAEIYQELSKEHSAIETPIWAGMLAQAARLKGFGVQILDCEATRLNYKQAALTIKDINPRIACLVVYGQQPSASTQNMEGAVALVQEIKLLSPHIKTLMVGAHVSALPSETLSFKAVDFVCQNEGVYTILDLLRVEDLGNVQYLEKVAGLGWKEKGFTRLNKTSPIVPQDKLGEELPGVAWDLLPPASSYRTAGWHSWSNNSEKTPFASLYSSLGCPFKCFPAGTRVVTSAGPRTKAIQNIKVGDELIGYNEQTGNIDKTKVVRVINSEEKSHLIYIKLENNKKIRCTEEHPFYVDGKWVEAKNLKVNDEIYSINFKSKLFSYIKIVKISVIKVKRYTPVYNFECHPHQNYFVRSNEPSVDCILTHNCSFCMINVINRTDNSPGVASDKSAIFRYWEPDHIIKQFDYLASIGVKNVKIADELFVLRENHFMEVCKRLIERNYGFNIWCYSRIDTCKPHYLETLKKAGVNWLGLGIESPNQTVRKDVIKGGYKEVKITDILKTISDAGINVGANYIFGLPEDTLETMKETLEFALNAKTENCNMYSAFAYPGSPLYYTALQKDWTLPDRFSGYSQHSYYTQNLPSNHLSAAEILKFRDDSWMKYFTNESYLTMMENKFGKPATDNIRATTKITLKRRLLGH